MRWRHAHFDVVSRYLVSPHSPLTAKISKDEGINISPNVHGNGSHDDYMHAQSEKKKPFSHVIFVAKTEVLIKTEF